MTSEYNQQRAIQELIANPNTVAYGIALTGQNPPPSLTKPEPGYSEAAISFYGIVLPLVFWVLFIGFAGYNGHSPRTASLANQGSILLIAAIAVNVIGVKIKKRMETKNKEIEAKQPRSTPYQTVAGEYSVKSNYCGSCYDVTVIYRIPTEHLTASFHKDLGASCDTAVRSRFHQLESATSGQAVPTIKAEVDALEYMLVPCFASIVYERRIPVFSFRIAVKPALGNQLSSPQPNAPELVKIANLLRHLVAQKAVRVGIYRGDNDE